MQIGAVLNIERLAPDNDITDDCIASAFRHDNADALKRARVVPIIITWRVPNENAGTSARKRWAGRDQGRQHRQELSPNLGDGLGQAAAV